MSSMTLWRRRDPFAELDSLVRGVFGPDTFGSWPVGNSTRSFSPAAEITRDGEDAVVQLELPGLDVEKDVSVEAVNGTLVVRGERRDERAEDQDGRSLREVRYGSFYRSFALPSHVTPEQLSADYDAGVLSVRVAGAYKGITPTRIPVTSHPTKAVAANGTDES